VRSWKPAHPRDVTSAAVYTLHVLARRILTLSEEVHDLEQRLTETITRHTPMLLTHRGVGPDTAAALLIAAGDNPDRLRSKGLLCRAVRRQSPAGILGQNHPPPAQPRG
jgi:hypothetical protein